MTEWLSQLNFVMQHEQYNMYNYYIYTLIHIDGVDISSFERLVNHRSQNLMLHAGGQGGRGPLRPSTGLIVG